MVAFGRHKGIPFRQLEGVSELCFLLTGYSSTLLANVEIYSCGRIWSGRSLSMSEQEKSWVNLFSFQFDANTAGLLVV